MRLPAWFGDAESADLISGIFMRLAAAIGARKPTAQLVRDVHHAEIALKWAAEAATTIRRIVDAMRQDLASYEEVQQTLTDMLQW